MSHKVHVQLTFTGRQNSQFAIPSGLLASRSAMPEPDIDPGCPTNPSYPTEHQVRLCIALGGAPLTPRGYCSPDHWTVVQEITAHSQISASPLRSCFTRVLHNIQRVRTPDRGLRGSENSAHPPNAVLWRQLAHLCCKFPPAWGAQ